MIELTIAYITNRQEPRFQWFFDSLTRLLLTENISISLIVVSPYDINITWNDARFIIARKVPPKPCVWSGPYRLTNKDYFSACNARNTAAALCNTDWIAYVDDLSVLGEHWLESVVTAIKEDYIALGCYQKVRDLKVENGHAVSFTEFPEGKDTRLTGIYEPIACSGSWMYGCSVAMPIKALLDVNGWPEALCDGMGGEDYMTGIVMQNAGYRFIFDPRMFTLESEEDHHLETPALRWDPGVSPHDKSHKALFIATQSRRFEQEFGGMDFADLHWMMTYGNPSSVFSMFPIPRNPQHEWFTGTPLKDL